MPTFDTPGTPSLRVRLGAGDVRIDSADTEQTQVELEALRDDEATREAIAKAEVSFDGRRVRVEIRRRGFSIGRDVQVGVRVTCPHGTSIEVEGASADVTCSGRYGDVSIRSASGDVRVDEVGGTLSVETASGDVQVSRVAGEARVRAASGDVRLDETRAPVEISTASGDQELGCVCSGSVRLQSASGDVRIGVAPGLRLWIDATSVSGEMSSELDTEGDAPADDAELVELRARTVSGDVQIVRAAGYSAPSSSASNAQA